MAPLPTDTLSGFLILDKPAAVSSAGLLNRVKRLLPRGTKLGHAGTLDPFATGVLVALVGTATRQCERVMGLPKRYDAMIRLGATTATLDPESPEEPPAVEIETPTRERVEQVLARFVGEIEQVPPAFSAIKVGGRRAYDLARQGETVRLAARRVRVYDLRCVQYEWPAMSVYVHSGRGFYVRSLARDIAGALGTVGYLNALRRTAVGPFTESMALRIEEATETDLGSRLLPITFL